MGSLSWKMGEGPGRSRFGRVSYSVQVVLSCRREPGRKINSHPPVRDALWLWAHEAGAHNDAWGLPRPSRIPPAEAALYLGIPNLIMVRYLGRPPLPFDQFALPLRALNHVVWSVVGAHGQTDQQERAHVLDLAARQPNITGVMLDDFFGSDPSAEAPDVAALPHDPLRKLRDPLSAV